MGLCQARLAAARAGREPELFQQGQHPGHELANLPAVIGQVMPCDESVVEPGAELLGDGELVAQVVVAGRVGQAVGGGLQRAGVVGGPTPLPGHGGQGVGRGAPHIFVSRQRLCRGEMTVGGVQEVLGCPGVLLRHRRHRGFAPLRPDRCSGEGRSPEAGRRIPAPAGATVVR